MEENQTTHNKHMANYEREELNELKQFLVFADDVNHKRELVKISLSYQHKRFSDNTGFATLQMKHKYAMSSGGFGTTHFQITSTVDSKLSYTPCYV